MTNPDDFFLAANHAADDAFFLAERREGVTVTPLIDGIETLREMGKAMVGLRTTMHMAAWLPIEQPLRGVRPRQDVPDVPT